MSLTPDLSPAAGSPAVGNFTQPVLPIDNPVTFSAVRQPIANAFSATSVEGFLKSMTRGNMRIREFGTVLDRGLLGANIKPLYESLSPADQGQIREIYLAMVEKVSPELRKRFLKLYAYY